MNKNNKDKKTEKIVHKVQILKNTCCKHTRYKFASKASAIPSLHTIAYQLCIQYTHVAMQLQSGLAVLQSQLPRYKYPAYTMHYNMTICIIVCTHLRIMNQLHTQHIAIKI